MPRRMPPSNYNTKNAVPGRFTCIPRRGAIRKLYNQVEKTLSYIVGMVAGIFCFSAFLEAIILPEFELSRHENLWLRFLRLVDSLVIFGAVIP